MVVGMSTKIIQDTIITIWKETLVAEKFTAKTYLAEENLANFVHSQTKNHVNFVTSFKTSSVDNTINTSNTCILNFMKVEYY